MTIEEIEQELKILRSELKYWSGLGKMLTLNLDQRIKTLEQELSSQKEPDYTSCYEEFSKT